MVLFHKKKILNENKIISQKNKISLLANQKLKDMLKKNLIKDIKP
jgi:hypothetical protein